MKRIIVVMLAGILVSGSISAQDLVKHAPDGFDKLRSSIAHGHLDSLEYKSKTVGTTRKLLVYTPPGYTKSKKYPVLYLLHGIGGDSREWLNHGAPQVILDNLYAENKLEPMIVVMPNGRAMKDDRAVGNIFSADKVEAFARFEDDLLQGVIPFIEKKFNVVKDREHRALAGLSMGGGQTLNFGLGHPDVFGWIGSFSAAPNTKSPEELSDNPKSLKDMKLIWISCGDKDGLMPFSSRTSDFLTKHSVAHIFYVEPGGHDFEVWKNDLFMFSQLIFKPVDRSLFRKYSVLGLPASTNVPGAAYPQILPDSRVIFRIHAPDAQDVKIDLGRKYDMTKDDDGFWTVTTDSISGGIHYYSLLIDGVPVVDPAGQAFYGMGRMASMIEIPFAGDDFYQLADVPHGEIRTKKYFSDVTRTWRQMQVYTPPGYEDPADKSYPVLYILHGGGEDERGWANQGKADLILDNLIAAQKASPMVIVMMDGNIPGRGGMMGFNQDWLKIFESELKDVVIPFVEETYRVIPDAGHRALAGLSMGGLQTLYAGIRNTDLFSSLGVFSSGWFADNTELSSPEYAYMEEHADSINENLEHFYISMGGKEDIAWSNCQQMLKRFDAIGINYEYSEYPGGHTWPVWRHDLFNFAQKIFR